ncbi:hypothetical protein BAUCODRAFT_39062 [Baudoinia panamericana UAMH 10762]|uniref:Uncharacterized protein n=1 Tax=Baudoinia panamericana (strain UAMH 10762) TaxID=717646 RepID=M2M5K7_BAUPA|nr:uncharacterized protein BAUCODRAFT_39062 [Baudoinia panamericana UAMH 10762]EMC91916.1 hypothetical protein BAUCODRAFT_39062 [Baudoinia panamericana UAMH 10762]
MSFRSECFLHHALQVKKPHLVTNRRLPLERLYTCSGAPDKHGHQGVDVGLTWVFRRTAKEANQAWHASMYPPKSHLEV